MSKNLGRIAVYYRVSTDKQDLTSQEQDVEKWLADKEYTSLEIYKDEGMSGSKTNRPEFQRMLAKCADGLIDTIITYRLDRFSRDASTAIRLILELDDKGTAFISVTQPVLNLGHDNPFRRTMLAAFAEISQIERETIVTRIKSGLDAARKRGQKLGPPIIVTEDMKRQAKLFRRRGWSIGKIAKRLDISRTKVFQITKGIKPSSDSAA